MKKIYIVGAHSRARTLAAYLQYLDQDIMIEAYLYDNEEKNPENIGKVPVISLNSGTAFQTYYPVYIGTRGVYHKALTEKLKGYGFTEIYPVTSELDLKLRNKYMEKYYADSGKKFVKIDSICNVPANLKKRSSAKIYVAKSIFDKPLQRKYVTESYEIEIQAGAELTTKRLSNNVLTDNTGENISIRNRQFCELTVLYWIWKNAKDDIIGLAHYRRHFILPKNWVERMDAYGIDIILPVPLYVAPSLEKNYKSRHDPSDWDYMMQCLEQDDKLRYQNAEICFNSNLYSPCNMFIMRKEVLKDLCVWLFPILFRTAEHGGQKEDPYLNRYPGFLSERLITFFVQENSKKYRVVYADKTFLP